MIQWWMKVRNTAWEWNAPSNPMAAATHGKPKKKWKDCHVSVVIQALWFDPYGNRSLPFSFRTRRSGHNGKCINAFRKFRQGKVQLDQFVLRQKLSKPLWQYSANHSSSHVVVARQSCGSAEETWCPTFSPDPTSYILTPTPYSLHPNPYS